VVSVGIIAFALMALYGCWMRHRDDSVEMDRRRAERERHLDSALGEHLHLGQRESRRLARTELEKQERAERAEKEKQAAAASADVGGLGHGGASSVEMSEMSERGISPVQVRVVDMPSEDERSPRGEEIEREEARARGRPRAAVWVLEPRAAEEHVAVVDAAIVLISRRILSIRMDT
jgi:hypothetical protein